MLKDSQVACENRNSPEKMPAGRMNMLATECSKPMAMNMEMGNHTPTIFPVRSCHGGARPVGPVD